MTISSLAVLLSLLGANKPKAVAPDSPKPEYGHALSGKEAADGWISLFDGRTTFGWQGAKAQDGSLIGGKTTSPFGRFQLQADVAAGGLIACGRERLRVKAGKIDLQLKGGSSISLQEGLAVRSLVIRPLGLTSIYNGKNFDGWRIIHHPRLDPKKRPRWSHKDGAMRAVGGPGAVQFNRNYGDLVFQIDVRTLRPLANGGVFIRSQVDQFLNGYEAQVFNACYEGDPAKPARWSTGAIDDRQMARRLVSRDGKTFTMTVIAHGRHIATWVNGYQTTDWTDPRDLHDNPREGARVRSGAIQLQAHDPLTDVSFSNIRITKLPTGNPKPDTKK